MWGLSEPLTSEQLLESLKNNMNKNTEIYVIEKKQLNELLSNTPIFYIHSLQKENLYNENCFFVHFVPILVLLFQEKFCP
ncbi:hypothetical protein CAEBREN_31862 [Caenorhabditis brenneri]|uniref:Uncharacterized protein n=1 Tax=Caenorhabditis brenneri TaxID=135651 RepID=G0PBU4_CAEBE|nr:hypothetical protein CAEBREN_31862 [Caenorhabditis brenneri]